MRSGSHIYRSHAAAATSEPLLPSSWPSIAFQIDLVEDTGESRPRISGGNLAGNYNLRCASCVRDLTSSLRNALCR